MQHKYIDELIKRKTILSGISDSIIASFEILVNTYENGNKVLICGNGGSASDAAHIVGELMKSFKLKRKINDNFSNSLDRVISDFNNSANTDLFADLGASLEEGLPTIDLTAFSSLNTAFANDKNAKYVFANGVLGLGKSGDTLVCISTSGNSKNVLSAAIVAKAKKMKVVSLLGNDGGKIKLVSDVSMIVPLNETFLIQEEHISIYHAICLDIEEHFYKES